MASRERQSSAGKIVPVTPGHLPTPLAPRRALAVAVGTALLPWSFAHADVAPNTLPTGGQYAYGSGSITQQGDAKLQITQTTDKGTINWSSFSIGSSAAVNFTQPSASSITLNRVLGNNPSEIFGRLTANGQVFLSNPNGVLFAPSASVDVGALFATTLSVSDQDANAGRYAKWSNSGNAGSVVNQGTIITANGYTALAAPQVRNDGLIVAHAGSVTLAAGNSVSLDMIGDGLIKVTVDESALNASALNTGTIQADGGNVLLTARSANALLDTVVNNSGVIRANSLAEKNGEIVLDGGSAGVTSNSGTLQAAGVDGGTSGGTVKVLGDKVALLSGTRIDVSGDASGGTALIGGNFHGSGPEQNASTTSLDADATVNADAITSGNGGRIAVWSNDLTTVAGSLSARGGVASGNGGFVETSGSRLKVASSARVDTRAPNGEVGTWLLDPTDFVIAPAGDIDGATLGTNLDGSNVRILSTDGALGTNGDILVQDSVTWTSTNTLELSAFRNVTFNASGVLTATAGPGSVILRADNTGTGIGTVAVAPGSIDVGTGTVTVYYNPATYAAVDLIDYSTGQGITAGTVTSHAWVFLTGAVVADKTYNGTTAATISTQASFSGDPTNSAANAVALDTTSASATFSDKNAAPGKTVNLLGYTLTGADASKFAIFDNAGTAAGGLATFQTTATASITKLDTNISGSRVYDASTNANAADFSAISALIGGDNIIISGTGSLADKNVGTNKAVTNGTLALGGTDGGNYNLLATGNTLTVTKLDTNISGSRVYDASTNANAADFSAISALIGGDNIIISGTGSLADKNVGTNKAVTNGTLALGGTDGGNYNLLATGNTLTVTKLDTNISGSRVYDASTNANAADFSAISALIGGDNITISGTGSLADKNVGTNKAVTNGTLALGGTDGGNYNLLATGNTLTVTKLDTNISGSRVYDASTNANAADFSAISALIGGDNITISGTGSLADKNVGTNKAVTNGTLALGGTDGGNYNLLAAGNTLTVIQAPLQINAVADTKTYDATITSSASPAIIGVQTGDSVTGATQSFLSKNALGTNGSTLQVNASSYTVNDGNGGNNYSVTSAPASGTITPLTVTLTAPSVTKTYDGGLTYATTAGDLTSIGSVLIGGDSVTSATIAYVNKDVGLGNKTVNLNAVTISDGNPTPGANYSITLAGNSTSTINRLGSVTWTGGGGNSLWSNPANWAGNAIPDLANVSAVNLSGASVVFDSSVTPLSGSVQVDSISNGSLTVSSGTLNTPSISTTTFTQTGGTIISPSNLSITASGTLQPGTITVPGSVTLSAGTLMGGGPISASAGTFGSNSSVATLNLNSVFAGESVLLTGSATSWTMCDAAGCGSSMAPPAFSKTNTGPVDIFFNGVNLGSSATVVSTITGSIGSSVAQIAAQALQDALDTDSVQKQIDYGFAGDVGTTPPMDHRIDETGISTPDCFQQSREGEPCS